MLRNALSKQKAQSRKELLILFQNFTKLVKKQIKILLLPSNLYLRALNLRFKKIVCSY